MTVEYFEDTDTLQITLSDRLVVETRDMDENTLVEFDEDGNLVTMTIEHAAACDGRGNAGPAGGSFLLRPGEPNPEAQIGYS